MMSRVRRSDDAGTSLVLALIFITVVSVVVAVVLSFADVSIRTTLAVRDQAAAAAGADGAAQAAINELRRGSYSGTGTCFGSGASGTDTLLLSNFYQGQSGTPYSAAVTCEPDTVNSAADFGVAIGPGNRPGSAILTLGTGAGEDGINIKVGGGRTLKVHGGIFSNSNIFVDQGSLNTNTSVTARGRCDGTIVSDPPADCDIDTRADSRGNDPSYSPPTAPTTARTVPPCPGTRSVVTFTPGLYTDVTALNNLTRSSGCRDSIFYFPPGTYYFNLPASTPWLIDTGYLVAGTPTAPLVAGTAPTIPGACQSPIPPDPIPPGGWTRPGPDAGVQFVFGGGSQLRLKAAQAEICGSYSTTRPPIAVYGLKSAVGPVPAQSGCVTATPYPTAGCAMIKSENSPTSALYIQGTTYAPRAALDVSLNNASGQVFRFGVIARSLYLSPTGSANLTNPVIEVPDDSPGFGLRTVVFLNVYLCPGSGSCSVATGSRRLRAKIGIVDPSGTAVAGARQMTVYSWSVQR